MKGVWISYVSDLISQVPRDSAAGPRASGIPRAWLVDWDISDLSEAELKALVDQVTAKKPTMAGTVLMLSRRARLGWTTGGHTGADVFLHSYGPGQPKGLVENTEVDKTMASVMGIDFDTLNKRLFVDAGAAFGALGYQVAVDKSDAANPVLVVAKGEAKSKLPISSAAAPSGRGSRSGCGP